jgi:hypothetical protein
VTLANLQEVIGGDVVLAGWNEVEVILWLEVEEARVELVDRVVVNSMLLVEDRPDPVIVELFDAELELEVVSALFEDEDEDEDDLVGELLEPEEVLEVPDEVADLELVEVPELPLHGFPASRC